MSDRSQYDPADEYVIGGPSTPNPTPVWPDEPVIGAAAASAYPEEVIGAGSAPVAVSPQPQQYQQPYIGENGYPQGYDDPYYDDDYYDDEPAARQPLFWIILGVGAVAMVGIIFLLFNLFSGGDEENQTGFNVNIDSPRDGDRIEIGQEFDIVVQASSNEAITSFELFINEESVEVQQTNSPTPGTVQRTIFKHTFEERGDYDIFVRITATGGDTRDSDTVAIVAIEAIDEAPVSVQGTVIAVVSARVGPGDQYEVVGSLEPDEQVTIRGKTRDNEWLLVDCRLGDGLWVRRAAIEPAEALALVPVREPTATPAPTATEEPSATPDNTPTPNSSLPDLIPVGATLVDGGNTLRATIANNGGGGFSGTLVVGLSQLESVTLAFEASIPAGGTASVDFPLTATVTQPGTARVTVDPDDSVAETLEDNNAATFTVTPPIDPPEIIISSVTVQSPNVIVVIANQGGTMPAGQVVVSVTAGGQTNSAPPQNIALAPGQTASFTVNVSGLPAGEAIATVTVDGSQVASIGVTLP